MKKRSPEEQEKKDQMDAILDEIHEIELSTGFMEQITDDHPISELNPTTLFERKENGKKQDRKKELEAQYFELTGIRLGSPRL